uniref:Peptidase S1 domain-containing protein n=1 Tax=Angiostrongylus cantonensis TaxID=6313 RepID=A0A0K0D8H3_ANGCA
MSGVDVLLPRRPSTQKSVLAVVGWPRAEGSAINPGLFGFMMSEISLDIEALPMDGRNNTATTESAGIDSTSKHLQVHVLSFNIIWLKSHLEYMANY